MLTQKHINKFQAWRNISSYHRSLQVQCGRYFDTLQQAIVAAKESRTKDTTLIIVTKNDSTVWSE